MARWICLFLLLAPSLGTAGAWPRAAGETFLATALESGKGGTTAKLYAERGWSERVTFGIDAYWDAGDQNGEALTFARRTTGPLTSRSVWALGLGLGAGYREQPLYYYAPDLSLLSLDEGLYGAFARVSAHYGRGTDWGWVAVDGAYDLGRIWSRETGESDDFDRRKLDLTVGYHVTERLSTMGQVMATEQDSEVYTTLGLSGLRRYGETTVELGLRQDVDAEETTLRLGLWRSF